MLMLQQPDKTKKTLVLASPLKQWCHVTNNTRTSQVPVQQHLVKHATTRRYSHELTHCSDITPLQLGQRCQSRAFLDSLSNQRTLRQCALGWGCKQSRHDCGIMEQLSDDWAGDECLYVRHWNEESRDS
jgi:hypothetical protein